MSNQNVNLFTQNELAELNTQLDQIRKNLSVHVNDTLSKAHGLNIVQSPYFDSAGDRVGTMCLAFHFGEPPNDTTIYVPARIAGAYNPPDIGPHPTSSGATDASSGVAGVPILPRALVTQSPAVDAYEQAYIYNQLLLAHSNMTAHDVRESQCHGGTAYTTETTTDTLGHVIGRMTVTIGVNGNALKLPGDVSKQLSGYGPPQQPRGAKLYTRKVAATSTQAAQWFNRVHRAADDDQSGTIMLSTPSSPTTFKTIWQSNAAGQIGWPSGSKPYSLSSTWVDLNPTGAGGVHGACPAGMPSSTFSISPTNKSITITSHTGSDSGIPSQFIRVKFTGDFGEIYSNVCLFSCNDEDGGLFSGPDSSTNYYYDGRLPGAATLWT